MSSVMKKTVFYALTVLVGILGFWCTIGAGLQCSKEGDYVTASLLSFSGILLASVALETAKFFCFRGKERKIYAFDTLGIVICALALFILNYIYISDGIFGSSYIKEFVPIQLPWIASLVLQAVLLKFKSKNYEKQ